MRTAALGAPGLQRAFGKAGPADICGELNSRNAGFGVSTPAMCGKAGFQAIALPVSKASLIESHCRSAIGYMPNRDGAKSSLTVAIFRWKIN
jgi:hypothetical protein